MSPRNRTRRTSWESQTIDGAQLLEAAGPQAIEVHARTVAIGAHVATTLVVTGYPAEVTPGWLAPLLNYPGHLDIALHIEPVPNPVAAAGLKRQRARLESGRRAGFDKGHLDDPDVEAAAADAAELAYRIARGEGRLFHVALYMTVHASDEDALAEEAAAVRAIAESLLMTVAPPPTGRYPAGWPPCRSASTPSRSAARSTPPRSRPASLHEPELPLPTNDEGQRPGCCTG
ncbi:hypothetical protein [Streptomyces sp. C8S0]|uniref:hypothetical protein n=1 Tax=Streptomyces sp. C8S0 TaxID=2585716 RepID=UPI0039B0E236